MKKHHVDIMISEADVRSRIAELGAEITHFYQQKAIDKLIVVGLLRGSFMFMADLAVSYTHLDVYKRQRCDSIL